MPGEEGPTLRPAAGPLGGAPGQVGRFPHLRAANVVTPCLPQRSVDGLQTRSQHLGGSGNLPCRGDDVMDDGRAEVEEGRHDNFGRDLAHRGRP